MMNNTTPNIEPMFDLSSLDLPDLTSSFFTDKQTANSDDEKFVVFFLDDALFAVPAREVTEVVRPLPFAPLPDSPLWLHGIANLRGEIVSVLDLAKFCGRKCAPVSPKSRLIILRPKIFASPVALLVDRLSEIINLAEDDIQPAENAYFCGEAVLTSNLVGLLDTEKVFASLLNNA